MNKSDTVPEYYAGMNTEACYQCGKCTAGCPVADRMDLTPNQIVHLVRLGHFDKIACSYAIWQCVSCQTCTARCPQDVDIAGVMDGSRQMAAEKGNIPAERLRVYLFQKAFLENIRKFGRLNEVDLIRQFKTSAFFKDRSLPLLMKDATMAPKLMIKGKFHLRGEKVKDQALVDRIFARCLSMDEKAAARNVSGQEEKH